MTGQGLSYASFLVLGQICLLHEPEKKVTAYELYKAFKTRTDDNLLPLQSAYRAIRDLEKRGLVKDGGKGLSLSGMPQHYWQLTEEGASTFKSEWERRYRDLELFRSAIESKE